ncbi:histidine-containing phosphotransfer protein 2-like [Hevea brasiliensis]|uniref:histidine-containing phosphotransfer protein 2-like n=1 Tax=Hevea brasiliensis TaxID=3981 RepID=UPI0025D9EF7D|nr:histidine-containing phosphotransfer protein 2-like [Hevea brasiliensis]
MATRASLNEQLLEIINYMEQEGIVDHHFKLARSLKEEISPFFFAELIPTYCSDARITIKELTDTLEQLEVDYYQLDELCLKLKGGTSCLGACRMARACAEFRRAIDEKSKDGCVTALSMIKQEFLILQDNLDNILEVHMHYFL